MKSDQESKRLFLVLLSCIFLFIICGSTCDEDEGDNIDTCDMDCITAVQNNPDLT